MPDRAFAGGYRDRRVLVTGASGFLGRWVARALSAAGAKLWVSARDPEALRAICDVYEIRGEIRGADLAESGSFARLCREAQPELTFNLAGYGVDPGERDATLSAALNARLVGEIAEAAACGPASDWPGLRLVHAGTAAEYGPVAGPLTEECAPHPANLYGKTKLEGTRALEGVAARTGLRAISARLFTVYGPGEHPHRLLPSLLAAAQSGQKLALSGGEQQRDFTYVEEAAEGLLRLGSVGGPVPTVVNLATGRLTPVREFVRCAAELLGLRPSQLDFGALPQRRDDVAQGPVDTARLEQLLGWRLRCTVREGIQQTMQFEARPSAARA